MKITISNLDLPFTIDTYGMFNGENSEEGEAEYYRDELGYTGEIDFDYDHPAIVRAFAHMSVEILGEELTSDDGIVRNITLVPESEKSPQFYNYTTDSYRAEWDIDDDKLWQYCDDNESEFNKFVAENWQYEFDNAMQADDEDTKAVVALDFWLRSDDCPLSEDSYNMQMWEHESEIYYENCKPSAEMQAELDQLTKDKE